MLGEGSAWPLSTAIAHTCRASRAHTHLCCRASSGFLPAVSWTASSVRCRFGSYRHGIQETLQFQAILQEAQRFYLLFQHGTTASRAAGDGYIVSAPQPGWPFQGFSFTTQLGPSAAMVAPDSRSQRSMKRILTPETQQRLLQQVHTPPALA